MAVLNQRDLPLYMCMGYTGFADMSALMHSGLDEKTVTLLFYNHHDAIDYECRRAPQTMRLVQHIAICCGLICTDTSIGGKYTT
jgi:hypothetical protein